MTGFVVASLAAMALAMLRLRARHGFVEHLRERVLLLVRQVSSHHVVQSMQLLHRRHHFAKGFLERLALGGRQIEPFDDHREMVLRVGRVAVLSLNDSNCQDSSRQHSSYYGEM